MRKQLATIALALTATFAGAGITHAEGAPPADEPTTTVSCLVDTCRPPVPPSTDAPTSIPPFKRPPGRGVLAPNFTTTTTLADAAPAPDAAAPARARQTGPAAPSAPLPVTGGSLGIALAAAGTLVAGLLALLATRRPRRA